LWREVEKAQMLRILDSTWKDHLLSLDHLRQAVRLAGYAQRDPMMEFKREAFNQFGDMLGRMRENITMTLARAEVNPRVVEAFHANNAMRQQAQNPQPAQQNIAASFNFVGQQQPQKMEFSGPAKEQPRGGFGGNPSSDDSGLNREQRRAMKKKK
jgi:preprotein translocase subunit SecA